MMPGHRFLSLAAALLFLGSSPGADGALPAQVEQTPQLLELLAGPYPDAMKLARTTTGDVLAITKYDVTRYLGGDPKKAEVLLDSTIYRARFPEPGRFSELSTGFLAADGSLFTGSWDGLVLRYRGETWQKVLGPRQGSNQKITTFAETEKDFWIGSRAGLWSINKESGALQRMAGLSGGIFALAPLADGRLVAATAGGLLLGGPAGFGWLWRQSQEDIEVALLVETEPGRLAAGTRNGLVELDLQGREIGRHLQGKQVVALASTPGGRIVATWDGGLFFEVESAWRQLGYKQGLADDSATDLLIGPQDRLWVTLYGKGVFTGSLTDLRRAVVALPAGDDAVSIEANALIFADPCAAAASLMAETRESGQIARENVDGVWRVFFSGRQICPAEPGYRRGAADLLVSSQETLLRFVDGKETPVDLPRGVSSWAVREVLVDHRGGLWVAVMGRGLFHRDSAAAGSWQQADTGKDVSALVEDLFGQIWVGVSADFDEASGKLAEAGLLRFDGASWQEYRPDESPWINGRDLATATTMSLAALSLGRVAVGTNGGLSVGDAEGFRVVELADESFVFALTESPDGRLWISHAYWGAGVTCVSGAGAFRRSSRDGLFADQIGDLAIDGEGRLWLVEAKSRRVGVYPSAVFADSATTSRAANP